MGDTGYGISPEILTKFVKEIVQIHELGVEIGIVIGGGNIFRGIQATAHGIDKVSGDYMGMLATVINCMAFQNVLENLDRAGVNTDDLADGSPNPNVLLAYSIIEGMERERSENGKVEIVTEPLNIQGPFGNTVSDSGSGVGIVI